MAERTQIGMSLDEFLARFEEQPFELIDGKIHPLEIESKSHAIVRNTLFKALIKYENESQLGEVFCRLLTISCDETEYIANAYYPDVIFVSNCRPEITTNKEENDDMPLLITPDLVVEVISPTDKYTDVNTKVDAYLADGVKLIWIVDPKRKTIAVYEGSDRPKTFRSDDMLTGGSVLPDFKMAVKDVFG